MDIAGAIDEDIGWAKFGDDRRCQSGDLFSRAHVEFKPFIGFQLLQLVGSEIGGDDAGAFGQESLGDGKADALSSGGDKRQFALEPYTHPTDPYVNDCLLEHSSAQCADT